MSTEKNNHILIVKTLKKIEGYQNSGFPILSVCLGISEKKSPTNHQLLSKFDSEILKKINNKGQKIFKQDLKKIQTYLEDIFDTRGNRSIVFFTAKDKLFEVLYFEFILPTFYTISNSPHLSPLLKALGLHKKYMVLLVDRKKARLFTVHLGEIEEHKDVFGELVPQKVRQINKAWMRENKILRHIEDHLHRHLKLIAQKTSEFAKDKNIHFIILGGHKELFAKIKKVLPERIKKMVSGEFVTELNIPLNNIFLHSKKIAQKIEQKGPE